MKVLDVGMGSMPYFANGMYEPLVRRWRDEVGVDVDEWMRSAELYVGFDRYTEFMSRSEIEKWRKRVEKNMESDGANETSRNFPLDAVKLVYGDGRLLPFRDEFFNLVILSDVLSVPRHPACACEWSFYDDGPECRADENLRCKRKGCECRFFPGITDEEKVGIIRECVRVLVPGGFLLVDNPQTPGEALRVWGEFGQLRGKGMLGVLATDEKEQGQRGALLVLFKKREDSPSFQTLLSRPIPSPPWIFEGLPDYERLY